MCQSKTKSTSRLIAVIVAGAGLGAMLSGCSDLYMDRRDQVGLSVGDATAANMAMEITDPWPAHSGNTNLAFNGQKIQTAVERYRTNTPWLPVDPVTGVATPPQQQTLAVQPGGASTVPVPGISSGSTTTTTTVVTEPGATTH
jgi:hypothetical protein